MLKEKEIQRLVETILKDSNLFLVDVNVRKGNYIRVLIDSHNGVRIDDCARVNRLLEAALNRDKEDFELEVSSPGLDTPLKVFKQYLKNINNEVDVIKKDGMKISGKLTRVDHEGLTLEVHDKLRGSASKDRVNISQYLLFSDIKSTRLKINL